jgi:hypothetical protein
MFVIFLVLNVVLRAGKDNRLSRVLPIGSLSWERRRPRLPCQDFQTLEESGAVEKVVGRYLAETKMTISPARVQLTLSVMLLAFVSCSSFGQTSVTGSANAERSWSSFWRTFTVAIKKKDAATIRKVMPDDFFDGGGGLTPNEWLKYIDDNKQNGSWRDLQRSVARGTVPDRNWRSKGIPTKVTKDNGYYFEFRNGRWYFAGVVGD